jgi:hypothetical protein
LKSRLRWYWSSFSGGTFRLILPGGRRRVSFVGIGKVGKGALLLAVGAAGGGAALAVASVPDTSGVIHACVKLTPGSTLPDPSGPNLRIIDSPSQSCSAGVPGGPPAEATINWNVTGPQGLPGTNGTNGAPGAPGKSVTVVGGNTFTIGGQVITVGRSPTLTVTSPTVSNRNLAILSFTGGVKTEILGYSFAVAKGGTGAGSGGGKTAIHDIQVTSKYDKSSPKLFLASASGQHFNGAIIVVAKKGKPYLTYKMKDVYIASAQQVSGKGGLPLNSFTLNFSKLTIEYKP